MKTLIRFLLMFSFLLVVSCVDERIILEKQPIPVESAKLKTALTSIETAFSEANVTKVENLIMSDYLGRYKAAIESGNSAGLIKFGELFKTRKLIGGDSILVVYQINYNGFNHEVTLSPDKSGDWKIVNF